MSGKFSDVKGALCGRSFPDYSQDLLFVFTAPSSGTVTVQYTAPQGLKDTAVAVLRGSCHTGLCIALSPLPPDDWHQASFVAEAGVTYYIDLESASQQPNVTITLQCP